MHRTRPWTLSMWLVVAQTLSLSVWQIACDSGDDDGNGDDGDGDGDDDGDDGDDGDDDDGDGGDDGDDGGTPSGDDDDGDSGDVERVCGLIDLSLGACDQCAADSCCAAFETCAGDAECTTCFFEPPGDDYESPCFFNDAYGGLIDCVSGPCAAPCGNAGGGGDGGDGGGSCNQTSCNDGPGGDATCQAMGCGACSFGKCLVF